MRYLQYGTTNSDSETEEYISRQKCVIIPTFSNCRIDLTGDLTSKYTFYLCFSVKYKTHKLVHYHNLKYSEKQKKLHDLIQSLHDSGLGYRKIANH